MVKSRVLVVIAAALPLFASAEAAACPTGGGATFQGQEAAGSDLIQAARELDRSAFAEDDRARAALDLARQRRQLAATLRQRARFSEGDVSSLLARADLANDDAAAAESRARTHTSRARAFRARAAELRARGRRILAAAGDEAV